MNLDEFGLKYLQVDIQAGCKPIWSNRGIRTQQSFGLKQLAMDVLARYGIANLPSLSGNSATMELSCIRERRRYCIESKPTYLLTMQLQSRECAPFRRELP